MSLAGQESLGGRGGIGQEGGKQGVRGMEGSGGRELREDGRWLREGGGGFASASPRSHSPSRHQ
eukprot:3185754-Rhodomonas_salina.1